MCESNSTLHVLYQSDDKYSPYLGVSMQSMLASNIKMKEIDIYIISDGIHDDNIEKLKKIASSFMRELIIYDAKTLREKAQEYGIASYMGFRKNTMSYLKLFLEYVIQDDVERLIYLDCDTLITGDLSELLNIDLCNHPIGMVQDCLMGKNKYALGIYEDEPYFNSGVILFDINKWREEKCLERIVDHAKNVRIYGTVDQDFYNVVLKGDIEVLDPKYNLQCMYIAFQPKRFDRIFKQDRAYYSIDQITAACKAPCIIHFLRFMGSYPLDEKSIHPVQNLFDSYLVKTPFNNISKMKSSLSFMMKIERLLYKILPESMFLRIFKIFHDRMIRKSERASRKMTG